MPGSSEEPLATLLVMTKEKAERFIEAWLDKTAPGEAVCLLYTGELPGFLHVTLVLPAYWYYDFTSQIHRPTPEQSDMRGPFRRITFDYCWLHVDYYTVVGLPPCPI